MIRNFKVDDLVRRQKISLEKTGESFSKIVRTVEKNMPEGLKLKIAGVYHSGYGVPLGTEDYAIDLKIYSKKDLILGIKKPKAEPAWQYKLLLKNDLSLNSSYLDKKVNNSDYIDSSKAIDNEIGKAGIKIRFTGE